MDTNEHNAEWHRWILVGALRYNSEIGKMIDLDLIEEYIDNLIAQVKVEERAKWKPVLCTNTL
jgi:hypothetical protein